MINITLKPFQKKFLLIAFVSTLSYIFLLILIIEQNNKNSQSEFNSLLDQAKLHHESILNMRAWSAQYKGVLVNDDGSITPNPYLKNNVLNLPDGKRLIRINPAWMTRQLSELSTIEGMKFSLVSDRPINPKNKAKGFYADAIIKMKEEKKDSIYALFPKEKLFKFAGALHVKKSCLQCHSPKDYKIGDIRGALTIEIETEHYSSVINSNNISMTILLEILTLVYLVWSILIYNFMKRGEKIKNSNKYLEEQVKHRTIQLRSIIDKNIDIMIIVNKENILDVNKSFKEFFDVDSIKEFIKKYNALHLLFDDVDNEGYLTKDYYNDIIWYEYMAKNHKQCKVRILGSIFLVDAQHINESSNDVLIVLREITSMESERLKLHDEVNKDNLTQLYNRRGLNIYINTLSMERRLSHIYSVIFFDIDHFKNVNDTYGHDTGDLVLKSVAKLVQNNIREDDFLARWGGEEFVLIMKGVSSQSAAISAEKLRLIIEKNSIESKNVTCSFGVTHADYEENIKTVMKRVDEALYEAKESGRNKVIVRY